MRLCFFVSCIFKSFIVVIALLTLLVIDAPSGMANEPASAPATSPATQTASTKKITLAVLPFISADPKNQDLADRMRFSVSQKMSRDGAYERLDTQQVDDTLSALQIPWTSAPGDADLKTVIRALDAQETIFGTLTGRRLTLQLYMGEALTKTASAEIPPENQSSRLTMENLLGQLANLQFQHIREVECDHSDPAVEARFAKAPNLVADPEFDAAGKNSAHAADQWDAILGADHYAPPLVTAEQAADLPEDRGAVVPMGVADSTRHDGYCLLMRMSKNTAENNGLACVSNWIPVEDGRHYRFSVRYHSAGPTARLFIKGFAVKPDQYSSKDNPESERREFYRAQILPRPANAGWDTIEMDFTPTALKKEFKIQWVRVDLFIYLSRGDVFFDQATVKKISP